MANITDISTEKKLILNDQVTSRTLNKKFGRSEDFIELHIYNLSNQLLLSVSDFRQYSFPSEEIDAQGLSSEINMDPVSVLRTYGFNTGKYKLVFNLQRRKIVNSGLPIFSLKEISSSRRELRIIANSLTNTVFDRSVRSFISEIESSLYLKDFVLNFSKDINPLGINLALNTRSDKHELLVKLLNPLPSSISTNDTFLICEEISDPISLTIDLGDAPIEDNNIPLQGPNFKIDIRLNNSVPSTYKSYNDILLYNLTSSYQNLLNELENKEIPDIQYDYIRPISSSVEDTDIPYHFENFVHFGSAVERLKNFEYKLELIELYDSQIAEINTIPSATQNTAYILNSKNDINDKKEKLIKGFDGYERFLYFTSGSDYTWPKQNLTYPYTLYSVTSSNAQDWIGDERSEYDKYGGQLLSASLYDKQNEYALTRIVPNHILDNPNNSFYETFTYMIGHHFDTIWTYIKAITDTPDTHHTTGISKELVYFQLKSLGLDTFDQFENSNLIEYILGHGTGSSVFYDAPETQTLITASNDGSIPKQDISKEVWKRLYHNAPYLLKTKGTERGLRALMSCYGVPSTVLNVKEYGGPVKDMTDFKSFSYEKSAFALHGDAGTGGYFLKTNISSSVISENFSSVSPIEELTKTVEFRVKPHRLEVSQHLFSLSGSMEGTTPKHHLDQHLILKPYKGNDVSSSGDYTQYGRLEYHSSGAVRAFTEDFPIFNGDFWNIYINVSGSEPGDFDQFNSTSSIDFGAYQANFNKHVSSYKNHLFLHDSVKSHAMSWGHLGEGNRGAKFAFWGGIPLNGSNFYDDVDRLMYSGSLQEVRFYIGQNLNSSSLEKHALEPFMYAGDTISSSFNHLVFRAPLGSNNIQDSGSAQAPHGSYHPNSSLNYFDLKLYPLTSEISNLEWKETTETHHHPTPDTVGASMTSEKVRIDTGTIDDDILSPFIKSETSVLDRQPQDFEDLGVFFSPTTELNEDIVYQLGAFRLDDYIGSPLPSSQIASNYTDLKDIKNEYFRRVKKRYNYFDYIKLVQYIDHTLFKLIEQFVPAKANLKTGLLIEPHYLERNKFARELPVINYGTTMTQGSFQTFDFKLDPERQFTLDNTSVVTTNNLSPITGSKTGRRLEQGTNFTIDIDDYVLDEVQEAAQAPITPLTGSSSGKRTSNVILGNVTKGRLSSIYYYRTRFEQGKPGNNDY